MFLKFVQMQTLLLSFFLYLSICLATLVKEQSLPLFNYLSDDQADTISQQSITNSESHYVHMIRQPSCANMTRDEFMTVFAKYPYFRIRCEAEGTTLEPYEMSDLGKEVFQIPEEKLIVLVEVGAQQEIDKVFVRFPISPCVRPNGKGTGQIEVYITLNSLRKRIKEVSGMLPLIGMQVGRAKFHSSGNELIYSTLCQYQDTAVRPAVEIFSTIVKFKAREWNIYPAQKEYITQGEWLESTAAEISGSSLVISCLSEHYFPEVCQWSETSALTDLLRFF